MDVNGYDASIGHTLGVSASARPPRAARIICTARCARDYSDTRWQGLDMFQGLNYKYQQSLIPCPQGATTNAACYALENKSGNAGTECRTAAMRR